MNHALKDENGNLHIVNTLQKERDEKGKTILPYEELVAIVFNELAQFTVVFTSGLLKDILNIDLEISNPV